MAANILCSSPPTQTSRHEHRCIPSIHTSCAHTLYTRATNLNAKNMAKDMAPPPKHGNLWRHQAIYVTDCKFLDMFALYSFSHPYLMAWWLDTKNPYVKRALGALCSPYTLKWNMFGACELNNAIASKIVRQFSRFVPVRPVKTNEIISIVKENNTHSKFLWEEEKGNFIPFTTPFQFGKVKRKSKPFSISGPVIVTK